ncbi:nuclear transport factor 2 family protein [Sphingomonadaceae bacterium G21617-S1]|nr:nuclear transport factor 2 family protein [Sphingomonadaceae bacterium G21617-S1]
MSVDTFSSPFAATGMNSERPGKMSKLKITPPELRSELEDFYATYASLIDEKQANTWVDMFLSDAVYAVGTYGNISTTGMWWYTDRGILKLKERAAYTNGYHWHNPTRMLHVVHNIRAAIEGDSIVAQAAFVVYTADKNDEVKLHIVGRYSDRLAREDGELRFQEHRVVVDSETLPANMSILF